MPLNGNFGFLSGQNEQLAQLGGLAERYFRDDPATAIFKLRQFAELLSKVIVSLTHHRLGERLYFLHHFLCLDLRIRLLKDDTSISIEK
jgi:hypothetical protein